MYDRISHPPTDRPTVFRRKPRATQFEYPTAGTDGPLNLNDCDTYLYCYTIDQRFPNFYDHGNLRKKFFVPWNPNVWKNDYFIAIL